MSDEKTIKVHTLLLALMIFALFSASSLFASTGQYALLVQKSPVYGGVISPEGIVDPASGENNFVQVKALPSNGYEFAYWLGEVTEPTSRTTTVHVDSPKMVIAVFERVELDRPAKSGNGSGGIGGGGGLIRSPSKIRYQGGVNPASPLPKPQEYTPFTYDPEDPTIDVPGEIPVPEVPEPATLALLGSGFFYILRKRHRRK